jgi:hypothetical protein
LKEPSDLGFFFKIKEPKVLKKEPDNNLRTSGPRDNNQGSLIFKTINQRVYIYPTLTHDFPGCKKCELRTSPNNMGLILTHFGTIVTSLAHDNQATQFM